MVDLSSPLRAVVGSSAGRLTKAFDMVTVGDLLRHYPRRYVERGVLRPLPTLREGDYVTTVAEVVRLDSRLLPAKRIYKHDVVVTDGQAKLLLTFFGHRHRVRGLGTGRRAMFAGKVSTFRGQRQLLNPDFQLLDDGEVASSVMLSGLLAIYPATAQVASWALSKAVHTALDMVDLGPDPLPAEVREPRGLLGFAQAIEWIHRPDERSQLERAQQRLRFDEAFGMQVVLAQRSDDPRRPRRGPAERFRRTAAVRADRRSAPGQRRAARRPRQRGPDASVVAG